MTRWIAVLTLAGCVGAPEYDVANQAQGTAFANDKPAYDFFVGKGLTNFQSAGIVGNLDQESGVNPGAVQYGGGPGRGIAQWSVGGRWDSSSKDNVLWYAGQKGESSGSLNLQLEFIWYELTTFGYGYSQLKATTNVTDATVVFQDKYEICGTCDQTTRVSYAKSVLAAYGATPDWAAKYVSQSWPLATMAMQVKCGEKVDANIVLKNAGAKSWDMNTRLGTTQPRDRASIFAGADWVSPNRAAAIQGTVAPGANGTFAFAFDGPTGADCKPGTYDEFFGVVQEGVHWFSDSGEGGPPDNQIEALIQLVPGDPPPPPPPTDLAEAPADDGGTLPTANDDGGTLPTTGDDGGVLPPGNSDDAGAVPPGSSGGKRRPVQGGCSVGGGGSADAALVFVLLIVIAGPVRRRRLPCRRGG